ncbi:hypothetical protein AYL99_09708 [Fonsecaea erecta]|uniref:Uncharacterized protein n=1 Tax=Fonsecaea erecta TaxID=1367422 RepID=A0A178Z9U1_9EURO|nr:hypothetical protein AYL99_09708 [Fonsecaea erecta]OAP56529.1 hypothetical protein AYL99_09708 [Fonsecaea erecta]
MSEANLTESIEARKQRRRAAGRSGGEFELVPNSERLSYRYVWPDKEKELVDRLVSWARDEPADDTVVANSQQPSTHSAQLEAEENNLSRENTEPKVPNDDIRHDKRMISGKEDGKERGAFTRLHRRISRWFQRKKDDGKENEGPKRGKPASEQDQPWISKRQLLSFSSKSLSKEHLEQQDGRVSRHEEVNRSFFAAPERSMDSDSQLESGIRYSNIVDDHKFSDWE